MTLAISLGAAWRVKRVYLRYSQVPVSSGLHGAEVAAQILERAGIHDVEIIEHEEMLGDHYDPLHQRLVLSSQNYHGASHAAPRMSAGTRSSTSSLTRRCNGAWPRSARRTLPARS